MPRAITAIYRTYATATLVRDELERNGIGRRHVTIIPDAERQAATGTAGAGFATTTPNYADTVPAYTDAGHGEAFDSLHDLYLPEEDTRIYQQAIRNGDFIVSVEVNDDADIAAVERIMRRPEESHDFSDLNDRYRSSTFEPRRQPLGNDYNAGWAGRYDDSRSSPQTRSYTRDAQLGLRR